MPLGTLPHNAMGGIPVLDDTFFWLWLGLLAILPVLIIAIDVSYRKIYATLKKRRESSNT